MDNRFKNVIVVTGIFFQENETYRARSKIWPRTFANAEKLGVKVVVRNDGGVPDEMMKDFRAFTNLTFVDKDLSKTNTLGSGRREAFERALEIARAEGIEDPIIVWTEPEKDDFINEVNLFRLQEEMKKGTKIVIPERGEKAWGELPKIQSFLEKRAEGRFQKILEDKTGGKFSEVLDIWFGPKVFSKEGAKYFLGYKGKPDLWDSLMVPVVEAIEKGEEVKSVEMDFSYDPGLIESDTSREISTKRIEQYAQILAALGDPIWTEFFESSQKDLGQLKDVLKTDKKLETKVGKEVKNSFLGRFFR